MKTKEEILKQYHVPITKGINVIAEIDALDAMEEYANQVKPEWISVQDRLPDYNIKVLVMGEQKGMNPQMGGAYICISERKDLTKTALKKETHKYQCENQFGMMSYVSHWMPLPQPPEK